jgi:hypothetical protein
MDTFKVLNAICAANHAAPAIVFVAEHMPIDDCPTVFDDERNPPPWWCIIA